MINNINNQTLNNPNNDKNGNISGNSGSDLSSMFTKLLVAQVKYQDPLAPTNSEAFVNQLTQLSQTESLQFLSSQMNAQISMLDSMQAMLLGNHVGSFVNIATDKINFESENDQPINGLVHLESTANLTLEIKDKSGKVVNKIKLGQQKSGDVDFSIDQKKLNLPAGEYKISVKDEKGFDYQIEITGQIKAVQLSSRGTLLKIAEIGGEIYSGQITRFVDSAKFSDFR